jgi:membrane protease YdiL (CAAX protease family)
MDLPPTTDRPAEPRYARPVVLIERQTETDARRLRSFPMSTLRRAEAGMDLLLLLGIVLGFHALSAVALALWASGQDLARGGQYWWVLANGLICTATVAALVRRRGESADGIGLGRCPMRRVLCGALAAVPVCYVAGAASNVLVTLLSRRDIVSMMKERVEFFEVVSDIPLGWVFPIAMFIGVYEEILFRGFILSRLRALCGSSALAILLSSAVFGALHFSQGLVGMCQTAVVGLVLAILATRTRSIWPAILSHATIDSLSLAFTVLFTDELRQFLQEAASQPA